MRWGTRSSAGSTGSPKSRATAKTYLEASSPRREQIKDHLRAEGLEGPAAAQVAAHRTRDAKEQLSPEEVIRKHRELAERYGNQASHVVAGARERTREMTRSPESAARQGVTYARDHLFERTAVASERSILTSALDRSMGEASFSEVQAEFQKRVRAGEFRAVAHGPKHEGRQYTTAETLRLEREILARLEQGNRRTEHDPSLVAGRTAEETSRRHPKLNRGQREAVERILQSREQIVGLDGVAGAGKTTTLAAVPCARVPRRKGTPSGASPRPPAPPRSSPRPGSRRQPFRRIWPEARGPTRGAPALCSRRELARLYPADARVREPASSQRPRPIGGRHPPARVGRGRTDLRPDAGRRHEDGRVG